MAPIHIPAWDHAYSLPRPMHGISKKTVYLLSKIKFDGENKTFACRHISEFNLACNNIKVFQDVELCILFTLTLEGRIQAWYKALLARSIHSCK